MSSIIFILSLQYILLFCLVINYIEEKEHTFLQNKKYLNSFAIGFIGSLMIYIDLLIEISSILSIYTLTIRLLMIALVSLFPKKNNNYIILTMMVLTRLFTYHQLSTNLLIYLTIAIVVLISRVIDRLNINKLVKWNIVMVLIGLFVMSYMYLVYGKLSIVLDYTLFLFSIHMSSYLIHLYHFNQRKRFKYDAMNQIELEQYCQKLMKKNQSFSVVLIEIENLCRLKKYMKLAEYNLIKSQLISLIHQSVRRYGSLYQLSNHQYCMVIASEILNFTEFGENIKENINNLFQVYHQSTAINVHIKLMESQDFISYYNPQLQISNM